jgi:hypothetical protein
LLGVALHIWVGVEIYLIGTRVTRHAVVSAAFAVLWLVLPLAATTLVWFSNRFDLIATAVSMASLRYAQMWCERERGIWLFAAMLVVALGAREIAFATLPATIVLFATYSNMSSSMRMRGVLVCVVIGVLALTARYLSLGSLGNPNASLGDSQTALNGIALWLSALWFHAKLNTLSGGALWILIAILVVSFRLPRMNGANTSVGHRQHKAKIAIAIWGHRLCSFSRRDTKPHCDFVVY